MKRMMLLQGGSPGSSGGKGKRRVEIGGDESDEERLGAEKKRGRTMATPIKQQLGPPLSLSPPRAPQFSATAAGAPPALGLPFAPASSSSALPQPLADLVSLHSAIEGALIMHLSTAGSSLAASSSTSDADAQGRKTIRMPNLIEMAELGRMVNSGGRQFGQKELERLVWAWQLGVGEDEEDELRVVAVEEGAAVGEEVGGLGFLVSRKRVASKGGNGIQSTYGIGLTVKLKTNPQLPQFELVAPVSPSSKAREAPASPSSVGRGREGMSVVALWTQGKSARREELVRNLKAWARKCAREEQVRFGLHACGRASTDLLSHPQAQTSPVYDPNLASVPVQLPPIPRATLPTLSPSLPSIPGTLSPSPKKKVPSHDVFGPAVPIASPSQNNSVLMLLEGSARASQQGKKKETASERNRALRERVRPKLSLFRRFV